MDGVLIVVPTYDERANVGPLAGAVFGVYPSAHVLFVDDNSPDGTGAVLDELSAADGRVHVLHRPGKMGLGRAYLAGFQWALARDYGFVFEMDADFSHDPREIPRFVEVAREADLVLGSRYLHGIRITNWPLRRLLLSKAAAVYVRLVTGLPVTDPTGGYKCYRRAVLESIQLDAVVSNGYSFQVEMSYLVWKAGFRIREIPITFEDRRAGYSKMSTDIFGEALWLVWKLALARRWRGRPAARSGEGAAGSTDAEP